jgi:hypothetical protein
MTKPKNIFNGKPIRAEFNGESKEWLFAAIDVLMAISEKEAYNQARKHWSVIKLRGDSQLTTNCRQLKLTAADGKKYATDVLNKAGVLALAGQQKYADIDSLLEWLSQYDKPEKKYVLKRKDVDVIEIELNDVGEIATSRKGF